MSMVGADYLQVTMYMHHVVHLQSFNLMVGIFTGGFMNFPALRNWVSMFQNSMGGSCTTSLTLHDLVFPVAWFSICR